MENKQIAKALLEAQKEMGVAIKGTVNGFYKNKYCSLNDIREACLPSLHKYGVVVLQPTVHIDGRNFVKTVLLHESGEEIFSLTEIIYSKLNDAQSQGSGITYARRYGLQSLVNVGADDDDGNGASNLPAATPAPAKTPKATPASTPPASVPAPPAKKYVLTPTSEKWQGAIDYLKKEGSTWDVILQHYDISEADKVKLQDAALTVAEIPK